MRLLLVSLLVLSGAPALFAAQYVFLDFELSGFKLNLHLVLVHSFPH